MSELLVLKASTIDTLPHIGMNGVSAARMLTPAPESTIIQLGEAAQSMQLNPFPLIYRLDGEYSDEELLDLSTINTPTITHYIPVWSLLEAFDTTRPSLDGIFLTHPAIQGKLFLGVATRLANPDQLRGEFFREHTSFYSVDLDSIGTLPPLSAFTVVGRQLKGKAFD